MNNKQSKTGGIIKPLIELIGKYKYIFLVFAAGLVLILLPTNKKADSKESDISSSELYDAVFSLDEQEEKLEKILSEISGAGQVSVMLTLKSSTERIVASDVETDTSETSDAAGEAETKREESAATVIVSSGNGLESAITLKYIYPEYQGALIVAEGADNPNVKLKLTEATGALTGLGADKISVSAGRN